MAHPHRRKVGKHANEGARLLWSLLARKNWTATRLAREIQADASVVTRWLYCDRRPGLQSAQVLQRMFRIPLASWHASPSAPIVLPVFVAEAAEEVATGTYGR